MDWGPAMKCPRVLTACLEGNLASSKVSDGICKLLLPTHLDILTRKPNRSKVLEAEKLMEDARALCLKLDVPDHVRVKQLGLLDIRCIYYICNKGKEAEGREFKSIKDIADVFIAELGGTADNEVDCEIDKDAAASSGAASEVRSVMDMKDVKLLAAKEGFKQGVTVNAKSGDALADDGIFRIIEVTADSAVVKQVEGEAVHTITLEHLMEKWTVYKGKVTMPLPECNVESCSPRSSLDWQTAVVQGAVAVALHKWLALHEAHAFEHTMVYANPRSVRAKCDIPKGELNLVGAAIA